MRVWRIASADHATVAATMLSGMGAATNGGRWTPPGMRAVYSSETSSLAMLEMLARTRSFPPGRGYRVLDLLVPAHRVLEQLPVGSAAENQKAGGASLKEHLAIAVPSVVNPLERNIVINPLHPHFTEVRAGTIRAFRFDGRLLPEEIRGRA
jgi:RES domain-containing protein